MHHIVLVRSEGDISIEVDPQDDAMVLISQIVSHSAANTSVFVIPLLVPSYIDIK